MIHVRGYAYRTEQPGIVTRHVFSAGAHYDPTNLSLGPVVGCDEHTVAPGAGFDWHPHRGVVIVSWLLSGALKHEDSSGRSSTVTPGEVLVQATGAGIRHRETNPSDTEALVLVQLALLADVDATVLRTTAPIDLPGGARFRVERAAPVDVDRNALAVDTGTGDVLVVEYG